MLQSFLTSEQLRELVLTRAYSEVRGDPDGPSRIVLGTINNEVPRLIGLLDQAVKDLQMDLRLWSIEQNAAADTFMIPDTNVLLHHELQLHEIDWHAELAPAGVQRSEDLRVVIPLLVVDELDNAKRTGTRSRARATLKTLWDCFGEHIDGPSQLRATPAPSPAGGTVPGIVSIQLLRDPAGHSRLGRADDELVDRAATLQSFRGKSVHFLTYDTGAAFRAVAAGLPTTRLIEPETTARGKA